MNTRSPSYTLTVINIVVNTAVKVVFLLLAVFIILTSTTSLAQTGTSTIKGSVVDAQENVVPGATLILTNPERNFNRRQITSGSGTYSFSAVPPGTYTIEVEAIGFKKLTLTNINALVDTPLDLPITLEVGNLAESVTVTASEGAALNTSDASLGNAIERKRIVELPLNARNVVGLLSLQPGVTRDGYVNGARSDQANITLDGVDVNEQETGLDISTGEAFASVLRSTPDSLQEFRVTTTNPNADQGRSSGAQVSLITRSGENDFHGSLYYFHRNTATTANDWFNNKADVERPQLLRNIFGGSLGGPIKKDRAFFFFNYEGFREATGTTVVREVPLPTLGQGIVRYQTQSGVSDPSCPAGTPSGVACLTSGQISDSYLAANGIDPGTNSAALAVLADAARRYPANDTSVGDGLNTSGFRFNANTPSRLNTYIAKFDFNLTNRQTLFVRGNYQFDNISGVQRFPDTPATVLWSHPLGLAIGHTWTLSNTIVNRATYGLTREAFTSGGDSTQNATFFRFIFQPLNETRTVSRTTPAHNIVDDLSVIKGSHTLQFGGNIRLISNTRSALTNSFDQALTNPSFYEGSGSVVLFSEETGDPIFSDVADSAQTDLRDALTAVIGRYTQIDVRANYDADGNLLPVGTSVARTFATQEYEFYGQDIWRIRPNLTLTYGLRWYTSTPVYETNGIQVSPTQSLNDYFNSRVAGAEMGVPFNDLITVDKAGKVNDRKGYYDQDYNNFAPSVAVAWSPNFGTSFLSRLFGRNGASVLRGGFRVSYDRIGSQLAVNFDSTSTLGFLSTITTPANTFNVGSRLAPLFSGTGEEVRSLSEATILPSLSFPQQTPADGAPRIESSLDDGIRTPINYSFNASYGREIGRGLSFELSYVGRFARKLLVERDIMHFNDIRDPQSGQTWYQAAGLLADLRYQAAPISSVGAIPFFENVFPGLAGGGLTASQAAYSLVALSSVGGSNITDYTFIQTILDDGFSPLGDNLFAQPQYATFSTFSTVGLSNYNSVQFSLRQRLRNDVTFDFNYTYGHSQDIASGLQSSGNFGAAFILNPLDPRLSYANSDFDIRHIINANYLIGLPVGQGKKFLSRAPKVINALIGGWQLTGIFRYNSGRPAGEPFEADRWATNFQVQSNAVRIRPLLSSPTRSGDPNIFSDTQAAFSSFRDAKAGEVGDRNILLNPSYITLDAGLYKTFHLGEHQDLTFRWEVYNVTNTQRFTGVIGLGLPQDPFLSGEPSADFGKFTATQTSLNETKAGRLMQFALRFTF